MPGRRSSAADAGSLTIAVRVWVRGSTEGSMDETVAVITLPPNVLMVTVWPERTDSASRGNR